MKVKTRYKCKIIGSDYSAQEPRMNAHISEAYKDLPNPYYIDPSYITNDPANPVTPEGLAELSAKNRVFLNHRKKKSIYRDSSVTYFFLAFASF